MTTKRFASGLDANYLPRLVKALEKNTQHVLQVAEAYGMTLETKKSTHECAVLVVMNLFLKDLEITPLLQLNIDEPTIQELVQKYGDTKEEDEL